MVSLGSGTRKESTSAQFNEAGLVDTRLLAPQLGGAVLDTQSFGTGVLALLLVSVSDKWMTLVLLPESGLGGRGLVPLLLPDSDT